MRTIASLVDNERGAEMVEWVLVVGLLSVTSLMVFGPGGLLYQAVSTGLQTVADLVANVPGA